MEGVRSSFAKLSQWAAELHEAIAAYVPDLLGAVLLVLVGWFLARMVRRGIGRFGDGVNRTLARVVPVANLARFKLSARTLGLVGDVLFWLIILLFVDAATKVAGFEIFSAWFGGIVAYLPSLLAGGLIILAGYVVSTLVFDVVSAALATAEIGQSQLAGRVAQGATFLTALIIGVEQIGVDVTFLITIVAIIVGTAFAGVSLAFGLGARALASNLIGAHYVRQQFQPGQTARIGAIEGQILELTPTSVILATGAGRTVIPAKVFNEEAMVLVIPADSDE